VAAEHLAEEALALAGANRDVGLCLSACFSLGLARMEHGRYQAALHVLHLGIETATEAGELRNVAKLMNTLAGLHDDLGDVEAAQQWSQRALEAARTGQDAAVLEAERYALLGLASATLHQGQVAACEQYLAAVEPLLDVTPYARFRYGNRYQLLRAELALAMDAAVDARRWAEQARSLAESKAMRKNVARGWLLGGRALLAMGAAPQAIVELRQGVALADATQHAALGWQGRVWLAQALAARRQPEALDVARAALERIDAIAAALSDARLRDCFVRCHLVQQARQASAPGGLRSTKPVYPAGLSAREVEVLRLVAGGATNAHVAEVLSISPRTVDVHMTSVLAKTGSANRAAAVAFALRHGLT
jgi:DNA-binding CsgD family transcriptional regulator